MTPTFREVNKKYSTRYYLSLVLIDEGKSCILSTVYMDPSYTLVEPFSPMVPNAHCQPETSFHMYYHIGARGLPYAIIRYESQTNPSTLTFCIKQASFIFINLNRKLSITHKRRFVPFSFSFSTLTVSRIHRRAPLFQAIGDRPLQAGAGCGRCTAVAGAGATDANYRCSWLMRCDVWFEP